MKIVIAVLCIISLVACKQRSVNESYSNAEATNENRVTDTVEGEALIPYKNAALTAEFNTFLKKFSTDSLYQMAHVKFPLRHTLVRDPILSRSTGMEDSTFVVSKVDYILWNLANPSPEVYGDTVDINVSFSNDISAIGEINGTEGRILIELHFIKRRGEWTLQEIIDYSI